MRAEALAINERDVNLLGEPRGAYRRHGGVSPEYKLSEWIPPKKGKITFN